MKARMRVLRSLAESVWSTGIVQESAKQSLRWMVQVLFFLVRHPKGLLGAIFAGWLASLFASVPTTHLLMEALLGRLGMPIYFFIIIASGFLIAEGYVTPKGPLDRN